MDIAPLSTDEENARLSALAMASELVGQSLPLKVSDVQILYDFLKDKHPDWQDGSIALGIAFGELIAVKAGYEWVRVTDEWGSENSLSPPGWDACCHPISMIQKRIERREDLSIGQLRDDTIYAMETRIKEGKVGRRS